MIARHKSRIAAILCIALLFAYLIVPAGASMQASDIISSHSCKAVAKSNNRIKYRETTPRRFTICSLIIPSLHHTI